jgi:hypothetical protein
LVEIQDVYGKAWIEADVEIGDIDPNTSTAMIIFFGTRREVSIALQGDASKRLLDWLVAEHH